jgi:hypothetical protein
MGASVGECIARPWKFWQLGRELTVAGGGNVLTAVLYIGAFLVFKTGAKSHFFRFLAILLLVCSMLGIIFVPS